MIVSDFTNIELNYFRDNCNFVGCENQVFELRSQGITLEEIAEQLNMSVKGIKRVSGKVNRKITTVLNYRQEEQNGIIRFARCFG